MPVVNALVLANLCECRHKSYYYITLELFRVASVLLLLKTRFFGLHFYRRQYVHPIISRESTYRSTIRREAQRLTILSHGIVLSNSS